MASEREEAGMRRAIQLARRGQGHTSPNPAVGAVVLDAAGHLVGEGTTEPPGGRHAEVVALQAAGDRAAGGAVISTLEPCNHVGRTGPCTTAIADAGVVRVVFGVKDPNPHASGGADRLKEKGIDVEAGVLPTEVHESLHPWLTSVRMGRPHVTWKSAQSLDARVAVGDGGPTWVSSPESRHDAHVTLRAKADAIVVGSGTVLADDPSLTIRTGDAEVDSRRPLRVVMDRQGRVDDRSKVLAAEGESLRTSSDPDDVLALLHERGVVDVLVEGGPTLGSAFFRAGLVDRLVIYVAPVLLGTTGLAAMTAAPQDLDLLEVIPVGSDLRLTYAVRY